MDDRDIELAEAAVRAELDRGVRLAQEALEGSGIPFCEDCGGPIPAARRAAAPHARRCVDCQRASEIGF